MYIALLGRQPELSIAELERLYGSVRWFSAETALVETEHRIDVQRLGGTQKVGRVILELPTTQWVKISAAIQQHYRVAWKHYTQKITLGISTYGVDTSIYELQKTGLSLKALMKKTGGSLRLVPHTELALSSATSHHNKLGLSDTKIELLVVSAQGTTYVAESIGAQNITALAKRDQGRPRRDAFVGMLPPKLAQLLINLAGPLTELAPDTTPVVLDPFCGTGVILQEALLQGYQAYGSDLSDKMVSYSKENLTWLEATHSITTTWHVELGDAMDTTWQPPVHAVVCEAYLGQPFSAPPSPKKLEEVRGTCEHIISTFLKNLTHQIPSGTPVVLAVPAWRTTDGSFSHLPLTNRLGSLGYARSTLRTVQADKLAYFRPDQVVARELLIMTKR